MSQLVHLLSSEYKTAEYEMWKSAAAAIRNVTSGGTEGHIQYMVSQGAIKPLCDLVTAFDQMIPMALQALDTIIGNSPHDMVAIVLQCGVLPRLMKLLSDSYLDYKKDACRMIAYITAGTKEQIGAVIREGE